jgi:hypothetical protein
LRILRISSLVAYVVAVFLCLCGNAFAQSAPSTAVVKPQPTDSWTFFAYIDGYIAPHSSFLASPVFTADHKHLHLEARYGYEDRYLGSLWAGYNFSGGSKLKWTVTPMFGVVVGQRTGVAPGLEASLAYNRLSFYTSAEYVFDASNRSDNFFYAWPQLTYAPVHWLRVGVAAQHTKVYGTKLTTDYGPEISVSHKKAYFTTYVLNPRNAIVILEFGASF